MSKIFIFIKLRINFSLRGGIIEAAHVSHVPENNTTAVGVISGRTNLVDEVLGLYRSGRGDSRSAGDAGAMPVDLVCVTLICSSVCQEIFRLKDKEHKNGQNEKACEP